MSLTIESIPDLLNDNKIYNYLIFLKKVKIEERISEEQQKLLNTLELFAFGNYSHYLKYRSYYIALGKTMLIKLIKLTILSIISEHENSVLRVSELVNNEEYGLGHALNDLSGREYSDLDFEDILISMIDDGLIDIKIDDENDSLNIKKSMVLRDAYNSRNQSLIILEEDDILNRSLENATNNLKHWFETKLKPVKKEFDSQIESAKCKTDQSSRKRKTPDISS